MKGNKYIIVSNPHDLVIGDVIYQGKVSIAHDRNLVQVYQVVLSKDSMGYTFREFYVHDDQSITMGITNAYKYDQFTGWNLPVIQRL